MSARAPQWFEQKYIAGVTHVLQSQGYLLRGTTSEAMSITGNIANWRIAGAGTATPMAPGFTESPTLNPDRSLISATMIASEANDYVKLTDIAQMSENEQQVSQMTIGMALGQLWDRSILGTLDTAAGAITTIGTGAAAISMLDIMEAQAQIASAGVGSYEYYCALPVRFMAQLDLFRELASADYVGGDYPLRKQVGARQWRGITFLPLPDNHFAIPAANQADAYMWIKPAVGYASAMEASVRIDWVPTKKSWFIGSEAVYCSALLLAPGVRRLRFATNAALTRPTP